MAALRFIADRTLGKLARMLRMLGYDTEWSRGAMDPPVEVGDRILLTRDRRLAKEAPGAFLVEPQYPFHQARQVIRAFGLDDARAFTRCVEDNGEVLPTERASVDPAPPAGAEGPFFRCTRCRRVYWSGSHVERMRMTILELLHAPVPDDRHAPDEAVTSGRLEPLLDLHQVLDALFWAHRVALLRDDVGEALGALRRFAMHLVRHIDEEDALVLPLYAEATPAEGFPRGGAPDIFRRDHTMLREGVKRLERLTEALQERPSGEGRDLARLELLDEERKFVDLLAHHDHRERAFLYPRLAALTTADEQEALLDRMVPADVRMVERRRDTH